MGTKWQQITHKVATNYTYLSDINLNIDIE
jgi:hypothetical protein